MKFEKLGTNYAKFTLSVEPELFNEGLDYAFNKIKGDIEVKGFRKGHVPREIYDNKFGVESLYEDALNYVIGENYTRFFEEKSVVLVGEPKVDVDITKIVVGEVFELSLTFPIKPDVLLGDYIGAPVEKANYEVSEQEVNDEVNELLNRSNTLVEKEGDTLEDGDVSVIDFEGFLDDVAFEGGKGENHQLKIGSNSFIPGFEEQLIGMKLEEERAINVTFPEDYHSEDLAGKDVIFKVKLHEIKVEKQALLDDEFVKSLNKEGILTVESLKEDIKARLLENKKTSEKNRVVGTAVKFAVDNAKVDIPAEMIEYEKDRMIEQTENSIKGQYGIELDMYIQLIGMNKEQFESEMYHQAQDRVLTSLVIEAIADKENFEITDDEIDKMYDQVALQYNVEKSEVEKQISKEMILSEIRFNKAIDYLEENIKETNKKEEK